MKAVLGIIGGSGIYDLPQLQDVEALAISSPWGQPSAPLKMGRIGKTEIVFLPRHGIGHRIPPSEINYRANIDCMKRAGVTDLISLSACGSFREDLPPGSFVLIDQFIDRTHKREASFFGTGCVAHVSMADPVSPLLVNHLAHAAQLADIPIRNGGTYLAMEGPQFSSRAESVFYKTSGADVIGMTAMPEAKLAREAELSYALLAMVTDFDCWHEVRPHVDAATVIDVMKDNTRRALQILANAISHFPSEHEPCPIGSDRALEHAIVTMPAARNPELVSRLDAVAGRILRRESAPISLSK